MEGLIMEMTGEEMSHQIALFLGYKVLPDGNWQRPPDARGTIVSGPANRIVPAFHKSLDQMYTAREKFTRPEKDAYRTHLGKICSYTLDATAKDHAEAFLKTKGLWPTPTEVGTEAQVPPVRRGRPPKAAPVQDNAT